MLFLRAGTESWTDRVRRHPEAEVRCLRGLGSTVEGAMRAVLAGRGLAGRSSRVERFATLSNAKFRGTLEPTRSYMGSFRGH